MQQHDHDPYKEKYGRHSNFRSESRDTSSGSPYTRLFFIVAGIAAAVVAYDRYDRLRSKQNTALESPSAASRPDIPRHVKASPPSVAKNEPAPADEEPTTETMPTIATVETPPPPALPQPPQEAGPAATETEKPKPPEFDIARYEMNITHGNSFMGQGAINGKDVSFLADTGASMVVIPERIATMLGLKKGAAMPVKTGGGIVVNYRAAIDTISLGEIELHNVEAAINPSMREDFVLLGMNALNLLEMQWGKDKLVLIHKQPHVMKDMRTVEEERFTRSVKDCASIKGNKFDKQTLDCLRGN